jgi:hypothetical protein
MIIILVTWSLLVPLSFIIFATDFSVGYWIGHIDKAEKKTSQMGDAGDAASRSLC